MPKKLNELIDEMYLLRERIRGLEAQKKESEALMKELKLEFMTACSQAGTNYARGSMASASLTEQLVPVIDDWGKVSEWIMENDALYLVHRRISSGPWRELLDAGETIPGIEPFTKKDISLTRINEKD